MAANKPPMIRIGSGSKIDISYNKSNGPLLEVDGHLEGAQVYENTDMSSVNELFDPLLEFRKDFSPDQVSLLEQAISAYSHGAPAQSKSFLSDLLQTVTGAAVSALITYTIQSM